MKWLISVITLLLLTLVISLNSHPELVSDHSNLKHLITDDFNKSQAIEFEYTFSENGLSHVLDYSQSQWQKSERHFINFGLNADTIWLRFALTNKSKQARTLYISQDYPLLDKVTLYQRHAGMTYAVLHSGDARPLSERAVQDENILFEVTLPAEQSHYFYLKAQTQGVLKTALSVWQPTAYLEQKGTYNLVYGLITGFLFALVISNLTMFGVAGKGHFLLASALMFTLVILLGYLYGFTNHYLHPEWPIMQYFGVPLSVLVMTCLANVLVDTQVLQKAPTWPKRIHRALLGVCFTTALAVLFLPYQLGLVLAICISVVSFLYSSALILALAYLKLHRKTGMCIFNISLLMTTSYMATSSFGAPILFYHDHFILVVGLVSAAVSLSYQLIAILVAEREAKVAEQQRLVAQTRAWDDLLEEKIRIQEEAQRALEAKIDERTLELHIAMQELEEKNRELETRNLEDALTKVRNRRFFDKKIAMEVRRSRREQLPLAVVMIDIDHFKQINDEHGHLAGDRALIKVAELIKATLKRPSDEVCRYGGEEFALLLPNTPLAGAQKVAEQIRALVAKTPIVTDKTELHCTLSAGVYAAIAEQAHIPEYVTECADQALYQAKNNGRNQVQCYAADTAHTVAASDATAPC